ncbi:DUF7551 domain-containing protein [Halobaculum roseum]|uniref:Uncharacterized protein n=1 Tax=Halobaculum roseum TaxID=2175149 RepID=A0ABD5MGU6_9EURY|nr:hypothetical protein [Halobaculum roseum]QZY02737.1 hypothetical protein K6T36_00615 [Halobaculum roseum]
MIGTTLGDLRRHIESLADPTGAYRLRCARTGERPVPVAGLAFDTRATARAAARCGEQYRAALRRYDPQVPFYDLVAVERADAPAVEPDGSPHDATDEGFDSGGATERHALDGYASDSAIDLCHAVVGVVFEAVADSPHTAVQDAVMETYFAAAESVDGPDELCLRLLASVADGLAEHLDDEETLAVLREAGTRLLPAPLDGDPLEAALSRLRTAGMLRSYAVSPATVDLDGETRRWRVELDGYALVDGGDPLVADSGSDDHGDPDRIVTLPVVVTLFGRASVSAVAVTDATRKPSGAWRLTVTTNPPDEATGLTTVEGER